MRAEHLAGLSCLVALALAAGSQAGAQDKAQRGAGASAPAASSPAASAPHPRRAARPAASLVDLNTASPTELMRLPGIGEAEARRIVEGRPYKSKADLVTRKVLDFATYDPLKRQVVVDHRRAASAPRPKGPATAPATAPATSKPAS